MNQLAPRRVVYGTPLNGAILRPVIGFDIDGTLGLWHEEFTWFAEQYLQRQLRWNWDGSVPFYQWLGLSKTTYRQLKLAFRQSGLKRAMRPASGAPEMVRAVRAAGAEVWVCTTRPYLRLDNVDPDTRWWLRHHGFTFDGVLFGERKWADLARLVGTERVLGIADDDPQQVEAAKRAGLPAFLVARPYTVARITDHQVMTLTEVHDFLLAECRSWLKERNVRAQ